MRVKTKKSVWFDTDEMRNFKQWLKKNLMTMDDFSKATKLSVPYISLVIRGKRQLNNSTKERFKKAGYAFKTLTDE